MADHRHPGLGCRPNDLNIKQNEQNEEEIEPLKDHEMKQEDWVRFVQQQQQSFREDRDLIMRTLREDRDLMMRTLREDRDMMNKQQFTMLLANSAMWLVSVWLLRYS